MNGYIAKTLQLKLSRDNAMRVANSFIEEWIYWFLFSRHTYDTKYYCIHKISFLESGDFYYFSHWENDGLTKYIKECRINNYDGENEPIGELSQNEIKNNFRNEDIFKLFDLFIDLIKTSEQNNINIFGGCGVLPNDKNGLNFIKKCKTADMAEMIGIGTIYVMKNCGYYKIGKAKIGSKRFGEYTKLPEEPEYVIKRNGIYSYSNVEKIIHEMFKDERQRGGKCEWFCLNEEDLKKIDMVLDMFSIE